MNWLMWVIWVARIAFRLIGKIGRFRKEIPEAWSSIDAAKREIFESLSGGLTAGEVEAIRVKLEIAWVEIDDVIELVNEVVPTGFQRTAVPPHRNRE